MRLTLKLSGGGPLLIEHIDLVAPVSETDFRAAARGLAEKLGGPVQPVEPDAEDEGEVE